MTVVTRDDAASPALPAASVEGLSVTFGGLHALAAVSLSAAEGEVTAVIGPNGAGKTTLFNCLSGFTRGSGTISIGAHQVESISVDRRCALGLGRTFQTPTLINSVSVLDNVKLGCHTWTRSGPFASMFAWSKVRTEERTASALCFEILDALGLADGANERVDGLPHRQRRLVEIARAFASRPSVLLLDEPAAGSSHSEAMDLMARTVEYAHSKGTAILLVEHNVPLVMAFADRVHVLDFGRLIASGTPAEIRSNPDVIRAYLGDASDVA